MATQLERRRATYLRALDLAEEKRAAFVAEIQAQREKGRTLADIGAEIDLSRARVDQLLRPDYRRKSQ